MKAYDNADNNSITGEVTVTEPEFITEYRNFYHTVKNFKLHGNEGQRIKSLRREVFGVSTNPEIMDKILLNKTNFLSTTGVVHFLTRKELIYNGNLKFPDIPEIYRHDSEIKKARKYEKIALLRISIEDIKNKFKWSNTYLYSEAKHDIRETYELLQLTKIYHTIPCFAEIHMHEQPQLFGEVFSALSFHPSLKYPILGFQRCNDISPYYEILEKFLINEQLSHEGIKYEGLIIGENNFKKLLLKQYDNDTKYALFIYGVGTGSNSSEWLHTSAMIGEVKNQVIDKVINLDGYGFHFNKTYEVGKRIGVPFIRMIIGGIKQGEKYEQDLQPASWHNMNCLIYAADLLKSFIYSYIENYEKLEIAIDSLESTSESIVRYLPNKSPKNALEQFVYLMVDINKGEKLAELHEPIFDKGGYININYQTTYCDEVRLKLAQRYLEGCGKNNASNTAEELEGAGENQESELDLFNFREHLKRSKSLDDFKIESDVRNHSRSI